MNGTRPHPPISSRTIFWVSTPAPHLSLKGGVERCRKEDIDKVRNFNGYQTSVTKHFTATVCSAKCSTDLNILRFVHMSCLNLGLIQSMQLHLRCQTRCAGPLHAAKKNAATCCSARARPDHSVMEHHVPRTHHGVMSQCSV